jgi:hypothetical protein
VHVTRESMMPRSNEFAAADTRFATPKAIDGVTNSRNTVGVNLHLGSSTKLRYRWLRRVYDSGGVL